MTLSRALAASLVASLALLAAHAHAQPPAGAPAPAAPTVATQEAAEAAVAAFREAFKAKGLKGEERLAQRDWALGELAKVQHPLVVAELGELARGGDEKLRTLAVVYLGDQRALPALAGEQVLAAIKKGRADTVLVLSGLQSLGALKYLGADALLVDLMKVDDYVVKKAAITTAGQVGDMRLLDELLKLLGVDPKAPPPTSGGAEPEKSGGKEVVEEGYSWEGAEATVDNGASDNSGENAEAKAKAEAQIAANKAAAAKGGGGGGGGMGAGGGGGATTGRGGSSRSKDDWKPHVLKALKALTGEAFMSNREIRQWLAGNGGRVEQAKAEAEAREAEQRAALKR